MQNEGRLYPEDWCRVPEGPEEGQKAVLHRLRTS